MRVELGTEIGHGLPIVGPFPIVGPGRGELDTSDGNP